MPAEPQYEADLRWFEEVPEPKCMQCRKKAVGNLRDVRNSDYGPHCRECADKRLAAAKRYREWALAQAVKETA